MIPGVLHYRGSRYELRLSVFDFRGDSKTKLKRAPSQLRNRQTPPSKAAYMAPIQTPSALKPRPKPLSGLLKDVLEANGLADHPCGICYGPGAVRGIRPWII